MSPSVSSCSTKSDMRSRPLKSSSRSASLPARWKSTTTLASTDIAPAASLCKRYFLSPLLHLLTSVDDVPVRQFRELPERDHAVEGRFACEMIESRHDCPVTQHVIAEGNEFLFRWHALLQFCSEVAGVLLWDQADVSQAPQQHLRDVGLVPKQDVSQAPQQHLRTDLEVPLEENHILKPNLL